MMKSATQRWSGPFLTGAILIVVPHILTAAPPSNSEMAELKSQWNRQIVDATKTIQSNANNLNAYSRRGDAYFFSGQFTEAVDDYERMVELDPNLANSHWRRGIAYFYAKEYQQAAAQFEAYHSYDDVDRENGIWRYLSLAKAKGLPAARETLLKYRKTDREPFPAVYQLFEGKMTPEDILMQIKEAKITQNERQKRLFYAHLYIGLNHVVLKQDQKALDHLQKATNISWPRTAGYGPNWMWHVGRLHADLIQSKNQTTKTSSAN
ncbi:tetratricopeptide repeat protein [Thalassoroseus pseudoceratinae]|uniref:tetratricopeptide repeat protein n=1 Tax=Thalassoroseus pseudoceratinae TaxID=2713176 RepID=UPI001421ABE2|nr:tetratricopeptide repeat protein [Thalassoroseus pseudoceratinae]